jgi:hypothetical protein
MKVSPEKMLQITENYAKNIADSKSSYVAVGLPAENVGGQVYASGQTVVEVGAAHEYGAGRAPRRSFLNIPFSTKKKEIEEHAAKEFKEVVILGKKAKQALGLIGTNAVNIVKGAFRTRGYGAWPDIKEETKKEKGSSQVLIDTGTLRNSITYVVRTGK